MEAYLNQPELKISTINAMQADIAAERLVKGHYWQEDKGNGCFVGCVIRGNQHSKFEDKLGIPRILARLADTIFESLPYEDSKKFSLDFLESIKVGANLDNVWPKFAYFLLVDGEHGVIKFARSERSKKSIQDVADMYQRKINGEIIDANRWLELRRAADAADAARQRHFVALAKALITFLSQAL